MNTDSNQLLGMSMPLIDPELLSQIVATAGDICLVVSADGHVTSVLANPHHASFGRLSHWVGRMAADIMTGESYEKFQLRVAELQAPGAQSVSVELNHVDEVISEFPIRYAMHCIGPDRAILMLGRDLRPIAEMQQQLVMAQMVLERDYENQREMDTRYRVLMESTRDAVLMVAMNNGRIADLNAAAALMLGGSRQELLGAAIAQEFEGRRRGEFLESLTTTAAANASNPIELVARRSQRKLRVIPKLFRAAGERLLLCRIEGNESGARTQNDTAENLERLFHEGVDGIVLLDDDGIITAANESFLRLTDSSHVTNVRGRSMADFLARGSVDLRVLLDNTRRAKQLRLYATKVLNEFNGQVPVEISATYLNDRPKPGYGLVIRDASRTDILRRTDLATGAEGMRSVIELVGSSTLKDIVAETTEVVEKMCIQTAVDLTRNNRVAAAEMLGLSRQSLYVKLRKFGLLAKEE